MANINRLIAQGTGQNLATPFIGGLGARQNFTSRDLQNTSAQNQLDKQANVNRLLQQQGQALLGGQPTSQALPQVQGEMPPQATTGPQGAEFASLLNDADKRQFQLLIANQDISGFNAFRQEILDRSKPDKDFLKEERKNITSRVNAINKKAGELRSSIGKVRALQSQADSGSRQARAGMIINVARLLSPGIVTDADFQALTGGANPLQATMAFLSSKNAAVGDMLSSYVDPLGQSFNSSALLNIADSAFRPEAQATLDQLNDIQARSGKSGLNQRQVNTLFTGTSNTDALSKLLAAPASTVDTGPQSNVSPSGIKFTVK